MSWANDFLISAAAIVELPFSIKVVLSALTECGDKLPSESRGYGKGGLRKRGVRNHERFTQQSATAKEACTTTTQTHASLQWIDELSGGSLIQSVR